MPILLPLNSLQATLANAGGKAANLARLARAGFPMPPGFIVPTGEYLVFVSDNHLAEVIAGAVAGLAPDDPQALENASQVIRLAFAAAAMPPETRASILEAYANLHSDTPPPGNTSQPVAVRSSATTEDLPDLSFAGQQDTYLNVIGEEALLQAVVGCWSSLWTGRAIGYRLRNGISQAEAALAVIVQVMATSDVSGVLFTANPLTGLLSEMVIDAVFGLGEALVAGKVESDHYVVDALSGETLSKTLGAKQIATRGRPGGGVEDVPQDGRSRQALSEADIRALVALSRQVQDEFGAPQDIEWAFAGGKLYLLQSRPITSLFPIPQVSLDPLIVWFAFGTVQGLVGPITPLGRDCICQLVAGAGRLLDLSLEADELGFFSDAGERMWVKISDVIRNPLGNRLLGSLLRFIEPSVGQILGTLAGDPRLEAGKGRLKLSALRHGAHLALPVLKRMAHNMLHPTEARLRFDAVIAESLRTAQVAPAGDRFGRLANAAAFIQEHVAGAFPLLLPHFIALFGPSMAALNFLRHTAQDEALVLQVTRGLPDNVTTEMDLALWETATTIRADPAAAQVLRSTDAQTLAAGYLQGSLPATAQAALGRFMEQYGMRGMGEFDIGQPRWWEDPTPLIFALQSYLEIDPSLAPDVLFADGEQAALAAIETLAAEARRGLFGWLKARLVRAAAQRIRLWMGVRESPKFYLVRLFGVVRKVLLEAGDEFAAAGTIDRANDLFFLRLGELEALARGEPTDWKALVAGRRAAYQRELRRRQAPRVLVSDGRTFYEGVGAESDNAQFISGSPVSPGVVEGAVRVVLDPRRTQLAPGEILVCPGTDPSWTPLFFLAGGLITEVGGMMTHGSVVAREVGIPAVVGVHQATLRLKDGQRVRLDGTQGKVWLL